MLGCVAQGIGFHLLEHRVASYESALGNLHALALEHLSLPVAKAGAPSCYVVSAHFVSPWFVEPNKC